MQGQGLGRRVQLPEEACGRNKAGGGCEGGGVPRCGQAFPHPAACLPGSLAPGMQVQTVRVSQAPEQSR